LPAGTLSATVSIGPGPYGAAITPAPDRSKLFVTLSDGEVKVMDRGSRQITHTYYVGGRPRRVGFTSDGTAVVTNETGGYVTWLK
jgi:DNA-binding beta-propeller fold protein YncE